VCAPDIASKGAGDVKEDQQPPFFGAHAFIWTGEWDAAGGRKAIQGAAGAGLDFIEIPLLRLDGLDVRGTRDLLDEFAIGCSCSLGLPEALHLPAAADRAETWLNRAVDATVGLRGTILTGALYTHLGTLTGKPPTEEELQTVGRVLKAVAKRAQEHGVSLGIEAINRYETYIINLSSQALEMLERVDEDNVFVHLDTYHMNVEEKGFFEPIVAAGEKLGYVHLSESDRGTPGTGNVHWDDVFRALGEIHFRGPLVMESFVAVNEDIKGATAIWRDVVGDPELLIQDGLTFLRKRAIQHGLVDA